MENEQNTIGPFIMAGLQGWISHGVQPGDFLLCVLCNDLTGAVRRADDQNVRLLPEIVNWLRENAPKTCWGSPGAVQRWKLSRRREIREGAKEA